MFRRKMGKKLVITTIQLIKQGSHQTGGSNAVQAYVSKPKI